MTATGTRIGTAMYMAPEQWRGEVSDARVDQYALAIMTYEMLAGQPPFQGNPLSLMHQHLERQPPELLERNKLLNPAVSAVVLRGMSKHPEQRYRSCGAFAEALRDAVQNRYVVDRRELPTVTTDSEDDRKPGGPSAETVDDIDAARQGEAEQLRRARATVARMGRTPVVLAGVVAVALVGLLAIRWLAGLIPPPLPSQGVLQSGRVVDRETGRGVPNVYYLLLRPGATHDDWFRTDGIINDRVAAHGITDDRGSFRITSGVERGKTYQRILWAGLDYPSVRDSVTVASNAPDQVDLSDIRISKGGTTLVLSPTPVPPTLTPVPPTPTVTQAPATPTTGPIEITGRVVDAITGQGVPGVRHLVLRPGATYQDWMNTSGVVNELVIANGISDQDGVYRTTARLDRGQTHLTIFVTPDAYPTNTTLSLSFSADTPNPLRQDDIVLRR
jgi:hypothetical protein